MRKRHAFSLRGHGEEICKRLVVLRPCIASSCEMPQLVWYGQQMIMEKAGCMVLPTIDYGKGRPFPCRDRVNELESACIPYLPLTGTIGAMLSAEYHFSIARCMNGENL